MVTNEINTGLNLECLPEEMLLGLEQDSLVEWSDEVEKRFEIYGRAMCDFVGESSFGQIQRVIRRESLIEGDILVVLKQLKPNGVPQIQLISGSKIRTPIGKFDKRIVDGVELDKNGKHVAYYYVGDNGKSERIAAYGARTGRKLAWLVYSTDKRHNQVRGEPILSLIMQSLKEIDRYRDAALRKSVINSLLAMFISKTEDKMGTTPMTGAATMKRSYQTDTQNPDRKFNVADYGQPGIILDELQQGETPHAFKTETDVDFGKFAIPRRSARGRIPAPRHHPEAAQ
jgi:capsid protein